MCGGFLSLSPTAFVRNADSWVLVQTYWNSTFGAWSPEISILIQLTPPTVIEKHPASDSGVVSLPTPLPTMTQVSTHQLPLYTCPVRSGDHRRARRVRTGWAAHSGVRLRCRMAPPMGKPTNGCHHRDSSSRCSPGRHASDEPQASTQPEA